MIATVGPAQVQPLCPFNLPTFFSLCGYVFLAPKRLDQDISIDVLHNQ